MVLDVSIRSYGKKYFTENYRPALAVKVNGLTLYYSYNTIVAYEDGKDGVVISENIWGNTTGKHLNSIAPKSERVEHSKFLNMLDTARERHNCASCTLCKED